MNVAYLNAVAKSVFVAASLSNVYSMHANV